MSVRVSAIICTHNRAAYLQKAVQSLIDQTLPKEQYEIIVVDNASTDGTKQICMEHGAGSKEQGARSREQGELQAPRPKPQAPNPKPQAPNPKPQAPSPKPQAPSLRYIYEPVLGLSRARNTGWKAAKGEYVAYLDDDAIASPQWLERILEAFSSVKPQPGGIGGKVEPVWEAPRPAWLSDKLLGQLAIVDWGDQPKFLSDKEWLAGANMAFPKKVLEKTGGFKAFLGRKGDNLLSMEENLLRKEIEKMSYKCFYVPQAIVRHHIPAPRLAKKWLLNRAYWNGVSSALVDMHLQPVSLLRAIIKGVSTMLRILLSPKELFSLFFSGNKQELFELKCSVYARFGHVFTLCAMPACRQGRHHALCQK